VGGESIKIVTLVFISFYGDSERIKNSSDALEGTGSEALPTLLTEKQK
jgi:hypothetical protein